ncbi:MAG: DUF5908 family protein [Saprospiraceae bacterium]
MPIEIQELVISATISPENSKSNHSQASVPSTPAVSAEAKEEIIRECVQQVLEIMRKQNER